MFKIRADRMMRFGRRIQILMCEEDRNGNVTAVVQGPFILKTLSTEEKEDRLCNDDSSNILTLEPQAAEQLMDELWACGIRPSNGEGSTGQLAAVNSHLYDMKKLVFDYSVQKKED